MFAPIIPLPTRDRRGRASAKRADAAAFLFATRFTIPRFVHCGARLRAYLRERDTYVSGLGCPHLAHQDDRRRGLAGRGGQGVVLASQLLADALARSGFWVQSFPEFKAERRGAPISAFVRWDREAPIHRRYKVHECDVLAVVSASPPPPTLIHSLRPGGLLVLNRDSRFRQAGDFAVARVSASSIARSHGVLSAEGRPMANTAVGTHSLPSWAPARGGVRPPERFAAGAQTASETGTSTRCASSTSRFE